MNGFLLLILAGIAGAGIRFVMSTSSRKWTRASVTDTLVAGAVSPILFALLGGWSWTAASLAKLDTPAEQAVTTAILGYLVSHAVVNIVRQRLPGWMTALVDRLLGPPKPPPIP